MRSLYLLTLSFFVAFTATAQGFGGPQPVSLRTSKATFEDSHTAVVLDLQYPYVGPTKSIRTLQDTILKDLAIEVAIANPEDSLMAPTPASFENAAETLKNTFIDYVVAERRASFTDEDGNYNPPTDAEDGFMLNREFSAELRCEYSNLRFVSMRLGGDIFLGGAHPTHYLYYYTTDSETGRLLTASDIFKPESMTAIRRMIGEIITDEYAEGEDIYSDWGTGEDGLILMPGRRGIALGEKGVIVQYQNYEIAAYCYGQPGCTLPYDKVREYLTPLALKLIKN